MEFRKALVVIVWAQVPGSPRKVLVLRLIPRRGGFWQPVTGKVEDDETYAEGALREAEEESGLRFERFPQYLGLESSFPGRDGYTVKERAFFLPLFGGNEPPAPLLDGKEHDACEWLDPAEAAARVKWPANRAAIERATSGPSPLFLSKRGTFFQDGEEVTHERTAALLHKSLARAGSGWIVRVSTGGSAGGRSDQTHQEELDVVLEDTPRFVLSFDRDSGVMRLSSGDTELLDPMALRLRNEGGLVCRLANGWDAAFSSPAYYEIAKDIQESAAGDYVLHFLGRNYLLPIAD
jgi:8-oxo-dGTP pyrophosphatase MutT (NUDIX family)